MGAKRKKKKCHSALSSSYGLGSRHVRKRHDAILATLARVNRRGKRTDDSPFSRQGITLRNRYY